ncbi:MAG: hypothetical protein ACI80K_001038 [Paracoccaceae bacterium]|jgi:hypothetical protein
MLLTLIHTIALIGAAPHATSQPALEVPAMELALPGAIRTADVPARIQITASHFLAKSLVNESQWLIFTNPTSGLLRVRGLRPFECALLPIPTGGSEGMSIELIARGADGMLLSTGIFDCTQVETASFGVFIERQEDSLAGWLPRHGGRSLTRITTSKSVILPTLSAAATTTATHVPVPVPTENRIRDKSRKLGKKKLPPI